MSLRIDEFIRHAVQLNPAFMGSIRGATTDQVLRLEQLSGLALPEEY
jgi:hypothetical protein